MTDFIFLSLHWLLSEVTNAFRNHIIQLGFVLMCVSSPLLKGMGFHDPGSGQGHSSSNPHSCSSLIRQQSPGVPAGLR